ncbi:MAG: hypothetical protein CVU44_01750 [Chloroflexi bacterium HGW-Chloroflexi-6]|nr:MAG: hypothetical protein CVU44_01750 [Chloroflexi bacterium HGW-Chloroflexi-6]
MSPTASKKSKSVRGKKRNSDGLYNILTIVFLLATIGICGVVFSIFANPYSAINPFPPNTPIPPTITPTITPLMPDATWTPEPTPILTETSTPRPTFTIEPTNTSFVMVTPSTATNTASPTRTVRPTGVPYGTTVQFFDSTTFRPESSCGDFLVAGQALDSKNNHVIGLIVKLGGSLPGKSFNPVLTTLTGIVPAYGQSGFEFALGIPPVTSTKTIWVQLFDQSGAPLSEQLYLTTSGDCNKNLILVRFKQR